jgi:hypothetical protein
MGMSPGKIYRLSHKMANPVQSTETFFELSYLENFVDLRDFICSNQNFERQYLKLGIYILSIQSINKKTGCLGVLVFFVIFTKTKKQV